MGISGKDIPQKPPTAELERRVNLPSTDLAGQLLFSDYLKKHIL